LARRVQQRRHRARRVAGAEVATRVRALGPLAYRVAPPTAGGVLLVGDAAGFYDPFTGEGVFTGLRGAELAVETATTALRSGDCSIAALRVYTMAREEVFAEQERLTLVLECPIGCRICTNLAMRILDQPPN